MSPATSLTASHVIEKDRVRGVQVTWSTRTDSVSPAKSTTAKPVVLTILAVFATMDTVSTALLQQTVNALLVSTPVLHVTRMEAVSIVFLLTVQSN